MLFADPFVSTAEVVKDLRAKAAEVRLADDPESVRGASGTATTRAMAQTEPDEEAPPQTEPTPRGQAPSSEHPSTADELAKSLKADMDKWSKLIKEAGLSATAN